MLSTRKRQTSSVLLSYSAVVEYYWSTSTSLSFQRSLQKSDNTVLRTLAYLNQNQFIAVASKCGILNYLLNVKAAGAVLVTPCFNCTTVMSLFCIFRFYSVYSVHCICIVCVLVLPTWRNKRCSVIGPLSTDLSHSSAPVLVHEPSVSLLEQPASLTKSNVAALRCHLKTYYFQPA